MTTIDTPQPSVREQARAILDRTIDQDWRPTSKDLLDFCGGDLARTRRVKCELRTKVAPYEYGVVWGYLRSAGEYRIATKGSGTAREILKFYLDCSVKGGLHGYVAMLEGAERAGLLREQSLYRATTTIQDALDLLATVDPQFVEGE